jgi:type IV pilus assembly protein PilC
MLVFVVPQFENIFHSFGASLPFFTQAVIHISNQVQSHAGKILCSIIIMIISSYYSIKYVERARVWRDKLILRIPFVGRFMVTTFFAHWTQLLATLLSAGLTLVDALQIAGKFISNRVIHAAMLEVIAGVVAGGTFYHALSAHHCFPTRITQMIAVGENTGQLVVMLEKIADSQQMVMNRDIDYLSKWLEPAIMIILALVTGALIIAMYLPVFELGAAL